MKLRVIAIATFFLASPLTAGLLPAPHTAHAKDAGCAIVASDTDQITTASSQGLAPELAVRKALLARVIACAKTEAQSLQANLRGAAAGDDARILQSQLADKLGDAMNYYDIELTKVGGAGILGTQTVAGETLSWRRANYDPLSGQVADFILWTQSQNLFAVAKDRLNQTGKIVSFLETAAANGDLENAFANAQALVQRANDENQAAKSAMMQFLPPDQSLTLITQSLQTLSDAYKKFFEVNAIVQTLLPTRSGK